MYFLSGLLLKPFMQKLGFTAPYIPIAKARGFTALLIKMR